MSLQQNSGVNNMKNKYIIIGKKDALNWYLAANFFIRSLLPFEQAIKQFNSLTANDRNNIYRQFKNYDEKRKSKIPIDEDVNSNWALSVMVDANIIATEFNIDPLAAALCIDPPCNNHQRVIIK